LSESAWTYSELSPPEVFVTKRTPMLTGDGMAEVSSQSQAGPTAESLDFPVATIPTDEICAAVNTLHGEACARDTSSGFATCGAPDGNLLSLETLEVGAGVPPTVGVEQAVVTTASAAAPVARPIFKVW
jgi:hypothetical protein